MKTLLLVVMMVTSVVATASDKVGNGGDLVRATFFATGEEVINTLERDAFDTRLIYRYKIDLIEMRKTLTIQRVRVVEETLIDNGGSVVDAIAGPGFITLHRATWLSYLIEDVPIQKLVFHELLRAQGVNDDDYLISNQLPPKVKQPAPPETMYGAMYLAFQDASFDVESLLPSKDTNRPFLCRSFFSDGTSKQYYAKFSIVKGGFELNSVELEFGPLRFFPRPWGYSARIPTSSSKDIRFGILRWRSDMILIEVLSAKLLHAQDLNSVSMTATYANAYVYCN